ncbi:CARDB domain-containing protein [Paucibacter sp. XJ19-41]|uniref:CARDB domain-containing protein n=1 Tax=Paucibacter sp. XJ19-41 TaxID=2927824 RepID=UPI002349CA76|nr:CARDB domain-containing protein [Paucibacter sp. XJ19-41]MDC6167882.1 CARDB domain-containing protein [Paucibacter sp. XJ19-41]
MVKACVSAAVGEVRRWTARLLMGLGVLAAGLALADAPSPTQFPNTGAFSAKLKQTRNNVAVVELTGDYSRDLPAGGVNVEPRTVIAKEFYRSFADKYDFIVAFSSFEFNTGDAKAFYLGVRNDTKGLGERLFDNSAYFGSKGVLQGYVDMAALSRYNLDPSDPRFEEAMRVLSHEIMHRWAAHIRYIDGSGQASSAMLGRDGSHWSFLLDTGGSVQYGNRWQDNGNGSFTSKADRQFFSPLDLYLMGMLKKEEVPPFFLIRSPGVDATRLGEPGVTIQGQREDISIDQVIAANGPREPNADASQKQFRIGFVLLTRPGEAASDLQIQQVNAVRQAFETRLIALTGGRAMAHVFIEPKGTARADEPTLPGPPPGAPGTTASLVSALDWLRARQQAQGSWFDNPLTRMRDTAVATAALADLGSADQPNIDRALAWLSAQTVHNTDYVARRTLALGSRAAEADWARLASLQNADGGWGVAAGYQSTPLDTALAVSAFALDPNSARQTALRAKAKTFLLGKQNADGGWSHAVNGSSRTATTTQVMRALASLDAAPQLQAAALFLAGRQNIDGGFGDSPSTTHDTANVMLTLAAAGQLSAVRSLDAFNFLNATQQPDGSWDGSVYATGLTARALGASQTYNWAVTTLNATPDAVRDGQRVALTVTLSNTGTVAAPASNLRIYDGDPSAGVVVADLPVPPLDPGRAAVLRGSWSTTDKQGNHLLTAVADPAATGTEMTRSDNSATARVAVAAAPAQADLSVAAGDVQVMPAVINRLPTTISVLAQLSNIGRTDAAGVKVRLLSGPSVDAMTVVDEKMVNLLGRSSVPVSTSFQVTKPGRQLLAVVLDPDGAVADIDRSNNRADLVIDTVSSYDPAVAASDLVVPAQPVTQGSDIQLKATLHNYGTADAPPFQAVFTVSDGTTVREIDRQSVQLQAGASRTLSLPWRVDLTGALTFKVVLDPAATVVDLDRSNNEASSSFTATAPPSGPNLAVNFRDFSISPDPASEGRPLTLKALVRNTGSLPANLVEIGFYEGDPASGGVLLAPLQTLPILAAGASVEVTTQVPNISGTAQRLYFVALDPANKITEANKEDNKAFRDVLVNAMADLAVSSGSIVLTPVMPRPGDALSIAVEVQNLGQQAANAVLVRLLDGATVLGEQTLATVAPQAKSTARFSLNLPAQSAARSLTVLVDPDNAVQETNKGNNSATRLLAVQEGNAYVTEPFFSPNGDGVKDTVGFAFRVDSPAVTRVVVVDGNQQVQRSFGNLGQGPVSEGSINWDGRDDDQRLVKDGAYRVRALGVDGTVLAESGTVLDTNRTPILRASGTPAEYYRNLSCRMPSLEEWTATQDEQSLFAYSGAQNQQGIYRIALQGGEISTVVPAAFVMAGGNSLNGLSASARGERVAFRRWNNNIGDEIWLVNGDGTGLRQLTGSAIENASGYMFSHNLVMAHDGSALIAKLQMKQDNREVIRRHPLTPVGAPPVMLYDPRDNDNRSVQEFFVAPNRRRALLTTYNNGHHLVLLDLETGVRTQAPADLYRGGNWWTARVSWSPDSRHVVVYGQLHDMGVESGNHTDYAFDVFDVDFKLVKRFRTNAGPMDRDCDCSGGQVSSVEWSSDGLEILFAHEASQYGGEPAQRSVARVAGVRAAGVSENGTVRSFYRANIAQGTLTQLEVDPELWRGSIPVWWAPNDRLAAFGASSWGSEQYHALKVDSSETFTLFPTWRDARSNPNTAERSLASFAPSGRRLFFSSYRDSSNIQSACYSPAGSMQLYAYESLQNLVADLQALRDPRVGGLLLSGTAADINFASYQLEYANTRTPNDWRPVTVPGNEQKFGARLSNWIPPSYGSFFVRLSVSDRAGNSAVSQRRINWSDAPAITDVIKDLDYFSPNGDGVKDSVKISYRVMEPVHLAFEVTNAEGKRVRLLERDHATIGGSFVFEWNGLDDAGQGVPDGKYTIRVLDYEFPVELDTVLPELSLQNSDHAFDFRLPFNNFRGLLSFDPAATLGAVPALDFEVLSGDVNVTMRDGLGRLWRSYNMGTGSQRLEWDGQDEAGRDLPAGAYEVSFERGEARLVRFVAELSRGPSGVSVVFRPYRQPVQPTPLQPGFSVASSDRLLDLDSVQLEHGFGDPPAQWQYLFKERAVQSLPQGVRLNVGTFGEDSEGRLTVANLSGSTSWLQYSGSRVRATAIDRAGNAASQVSDYHPVRELVLMGAGAEYWPPENPAKNVPVGMTVGTNFTGSAVPVTPVLIDPLPLAYQLGAVSLAFMDNLLQRSPRAELRYAFLRKPVAAPGEPEPEPRPMPAPTEQDMRLLQWNAVPLRGLLPSERSLGVSNLSDSAQQLALRWQLPHLDAGVWLLQMVQRDQDGAELRSNLYWVAQPASPGSSTPAPKGLSWKAYHEPALSCDAPVTEIAHVQYAIPAFSGEFPTKVGGVRLYRLRPSGERELIADVAADNFGRGIDFQPQFSTADWPVGRHDFEIDLKLDGGWTSSAKPYIYVNHSAPKVRIGAPLDGQKMCATQIKVPGVGTIGYVPMSVQVDEPYAAHQDLQRLLPNGSWLHRGPVGERDDELGAASTKSSGKYKVCGLPGGCDDSGPLVWPSKPGKFVRPTSGRLYGLGQGSKDDYELDPLDGQVSARLRAYGPSGHLVCTPVTVDVDGRVDGGANLDRDLFSPNGDGRLDEVLLSITALEALTVRIEVVRASRTLDGRLVAAEGPALATLVDNQQLDNGSRDYPWDGRAGQVVADGQYALRVALTDGCGNEKIVLLGVVVDNTPPAIAIDTPRPNAQLPLELNIQGTISDVHPLRYEIAIVMDASPDAPIPLPPLGGMNRPHVDLATLKALGLTGAARLVVQAYDMAGNINRLEVPVQLAEPSELISSFNAAPDPFSPNGDGRRDKVSLFYTLTRPAQLTLELQRMPGGQKIKTLLDKVAGKQGDSVLLWDGLNAQGLVEPDEDVAAVLTAEVINDGNVTARQVARAGFVLDKTPPVITFSLPDRPVSTGGGGVVVRAADPLFSDAALSLSINGGGFLALAETQEVTGVITAPLDDLPEGPIKLRVKANDRAENTSTTTLDVILDRTPPKVTITAPKPEAFISGRLLTPQVIEGSIEELHLSRYTLTLGDQPLGSATAMPVGPALLSWNPLQHADGPYALKLKAEDQAGLTGETAVAITVDNTPPVAVLKGVVTGTNWLRVGAKILGSATDTNLQNYRLELSPGGAATGRWNELGRGSTAVADGVLLNANALPADGVYGLRLTVLDKAGNESSAQMDVTVDTTPPQTVTLSAELKNSRDADIKWAAANQSDVAGYILMRNGSRVGSTLISGTSYADTNLAPGTYAYVVKAVDFAGNESEPSNEGRVVVSSSEPVAQIFVPVRDGYAAGLADVRGTASAPTDFKEYRLFVGSGAVPTTWQLLRRSPVPITADQLAQWNTVGSTTDGTLYTLKLEAENISGTVATDRVTVKVKNTPPKVPLQLHGTLNVNNIALGWTANTDTDLQGYLLYRDQRLANASGVVIGSLVPYLIKPTAYNDLGVPDGLHRYVVVAMDAAGNLSDPSNEVEFKVDTRPPHVPVTKPADGNKVSGIVTLVGESPDSDIATVQFQLKPSASGNWTNIGAPLTNASGPWTISWNTEGLAYGSYQVRAVATDDGNKTDPTPGFITVLVTDLRKPEPATALTARVAGGDVTLNWQVSASSFASGYHVDRVNADQSVTRLTGSPITETTLKDLGRPDASYAYRVVALSHGGTESDPSNTAYAVVFTPEFEQPLTPTADVNLVLQGLTRNQHQVLLQTQAGQPVAEVRSDDNGIYQFASLPLALGDNRFQIVARDDEGNTSKTVFWHARRGVAPAAPTGLNAQVTDHNVNLSWAANAEADLLGYLPLLEGQARGGDAGPGSATASSSDPSGNNYQPFRAVAADANTGWRPHYAERLRGQWLEVQLGSQRLMDSVKLRWSELAYDYRVEAYDGEVWVPLARYQSTDNPYEVELKFARPYRSDRLRVRILDQWDHGVQLNDVQVHLLEVGSARSTAFNNLPDGKPKLGVKAVSTLGLISPLAEITPNVGDVTPPDAPVLQAVAQGADAALSWTGPNAADIGGFRIERDGVLIATLPDGSLRTYLDPGLPNGSYRYVVTAVDAVGNIGLPSNSASVTIDLQGPSAPIVASAKVAPAGGAVLLDWTVGAGPQPAQFQLQRSLSAGGPYDVRISNLDGAQRSYVDETVQNGQRYFYVVLGQDAQGRPGASSNEVSAKPEDRVAPGLPYFVLPGRSPGPVLTRDAQTDLIGYADPGSQVMITLGEQRLGATQASSDDQSRYFDGNRYVFDVTPDGRLIYFRNNESDLFTAYGDPVASRALQSLNSVSRLRLAPDGGSAAVIYYDSYQGRDQLGRWDREQDRVSTIPVAVNEQSPLAFSPDGKTLALGAVDGNGIAGLVLIDWTSGAQRRLEMQADHLAWSPDGKTLALASTSGLALLDLAQGQAQPTAPVGAAYSSAWLPDGSGLLVEHAGEQNQHAISRLDLPSQALQRLAGDAGNSYKQPVLAPDASGYLALRNGYELMLRGFDGSERMLDNATDNYGAPVWTQARTIGYLRGWGQFMLHVPAGQFQMRGVALTPGANLFGAYALDEAGNTSAPALPLEVRRLADTLPDWAVGEDSWQVFPATPQVGDNVTVALTVKNLGAAAPETTVSVVLVDAAGQISRLYNGPLAALARDGQQTLRASWKATQPGRYLLMAVVDPRDLSQEQSKDNNQTARELLLVSEAGRPELQVRTDKARYQGGETVKAEVSAVYAGARFDGQLLVRLVDTGGYELSRFETRSVQNLRFGTPQTFSFSWPSGATLAGDYRVLAELSDTSGAAVATAHGDFILAAGVLLEAKVATDQAEYLQGDAVKAQGSLRYVSGNLPALDSPVLLSLVSASGDVLATRALDLKGLLPGAEVRLDLSWLTSQTGDFNAVLRAGPEDAPTATAQSAFRVGPPNAPLVQGRLQLAGEVFNTDEAIAAQFSVSNRGALLDPLPLRVSAFDAAAGRVLADWTTQLPGVGATPVPSGTVLNGPWPLGSFELRLEVQVGGNWLLLDKARVRAAERVAPGIAFVLPVANTVMRSDADVMTLVATRQNPVSKVELQAADGAWTSMVVRDAVNGRYVSNTLPTADGPLLLKARATDSQGNVSTLALLNVVIDNTPPAITITGVAQGQRYSGSALPVITITDAHLLSSEVLLDGQPYVSGTPVTTAGSHSLSVKAADRAGNESQQALSFIVDAQQSLSGSLGVSPALAPIGETVALDARLSNGSSTALSGVQLTLVLRDRASGQVLQSFSEVANLPASGSYQHAWTWVAAGTVGAYVDAQLSATVNGVTTPIASGSLQLAAPNARVELQTQLAPPNRLLVYVKCNRLEDDTWDNCATAMRSYSDPATVASCSADRATWLGQYLNVRGVNHTLVTDEASFLRELRSGRYGRYWLGGGALVLGSMATAELQAAVRRGDALLTEGWMPGHTLGLEGLSSIGFLGKWSSQQANVSTSGPVLPVLTLTASKPVRLSTVNGTRLAVMNNGNGIVSASYGLGRTMAFAFDLSGTLRGAADNTLLSWNGVVQGALEWLAPAARTEVAAGGVIELRASLANTGGQALLLDYIAKLPAQGQALQTTPEATAITQEGGLPTLRWRANPAAGENLKFGTTLRAPLVAADYVLPHQVNQVNADGSSTLVLSQPQNLRVNSATGLLNSAYDQLQALTLTGAEAAAKAGTLGWLAQAKLAVADARWDDALRQLIAAQASLQGVAGSAAEETKLALARAIEAVERRL